jgi:hypothetical protein
MPTARDDSAAPAPARPAQAGPPMGVLAGVSLLLLSCGIAVSTALGGVVPSPFGDPATIAAYFATQADAVRAMGVFVFSSAVPLAIYAATAGSRLRSLGVTAPGATIAQVGGTLAAGMLALCGLVAWVLARPDIRTETALVRALHDLAFLTGGVGHVVFLGLLMAGIAVPGLILGLLPRGVAVTGLVIAAVAEAATVSLAWDAAAVLLPIARFPGLVWLVAVGFMLPHSRRRLIATEAVGA